MLNRLLRLSDKQLPLNPADLALNLSFVLHERSDSLSVQRAVRASMSHARYADQPDPNLAKPVSGIDCTPDGVDMWLTASLGLPEMLAAALDTSPELVITVDSAMSPNQRAPFFRAPATLRLPVSHATRVGVAALVLRPGRRTSHLDIASVHDWQTNSDDALRSLERLIQAHAGQWMPPRALWDAPAEILLAGEVY